MQRKAGPPKLRVFRLLGPLSGGPGGLPNLEQRGRDSTVAVGSRSRFRGPPAEEGYALPGAPLTPESPKRWHYSPAPMGWLFQNRQTLKQLPLQVDRLETYGRI